MTGLDSIYMKKSKKMHSSCATATEGEERVVKRSDDRQAILYAGIHLAGYSLNRPMVNVTPAPAATVETMGDYRRLWRRQLPRISL